MRSPEAYATATLCGAPCGQGSQRAAALGLRLAKVSWAFFGAQRTGTTRRCVCAHPRLHRLWPLRARERPATISAVTGARGSPSLGTAPTPAFWRAAGSRAGSPAVIHLRRQQSSHGGVHERARALAAQQEPDGAAPPPEPARRLPAQPPGARSAGPACRRRRPAPLHVPGVERAVLALLPSAQVCDARGAGSLAWARFVAGAADHAGLGGAPPRQGITLEEVALHCTEDDAWTVRAAAAARPPAHWPCRPVGQHLQPRAARTPPPSKPPSPTRPAPLAPRRCCVARCTI